MNDFPHAPSDWKPSDAEYLAKELQHTGGKFIKRLLPRISASRNVAEVSVIKLNMIVLQTERAAIDNAGVLGGDIILLGDGLIREMGNHEQLMALPEGRYRKLYNTHAGKGIITEE